jgi:sulfite reductase alpha subunit-like flavoprotein
MLEAIAVHSGKGAEYAAEYLAAMKKQKRYLRDVY